MSTAYNTNAACPHCGFRHETTCPRIKRIEYGPNGEVKAIELHLPAPINWGDQPTFKVTWW